MECVAYNQGRCRSCTLLAVAPPDQVSAKQQRIDCLLRSSIGDRAAGVVWHAPVASAPSGFRTKAKMVVGGTPAAPTIGILDAAGHGVDLQDCPLYDPRLVAAFPVLAEFVGVAALQPYDVPTRSGELKHLVMTVAPSGELMVRFVMRSTEALARLRKHLPWLVERLPMLAVATLNVLPEHKAVIEGDREIWLTERESLPMQMGAVTLHLRPQSFFQTNTAVAQGLYATVAAWVERVRPTRLWDLYCGVGGFALHCLGEGREVVGIESSEQAVASATRSAADLALAGAPGAASARFEAADATTWALDQTPPDLVIVNPPRRGIGASLAAWIERSGVPDVVYSSCNPATLAQDLAAMASYVPREARVLDMFPHTDHVEVVVRLERV